MKSNTFISQSLTAGLYLALVGIIISLLMWMFNFIPTSAGSGILAFLVTLGVNFFFLYYFTKKYRDDYLGGFISYGNALVFAIAMVACSAIIVAFYNYIFSTLIDPGYMERVMNATTESMENRLSGRGMSPEQVDLFMARMEDRVAKRLDRSPLVTALRAIPGSVIFGTIVGLISSAFVKKTEDIVSENN